MVERQVIIENKLGLHARAAARFVHTASRFDAKIQIHSDGQVVDGKSILGLLLLAATQGATLTIEARGRDEDDALDALCCLIKDRFGEGA